MQLQEKTGPRAQAVFPEPYGALGHPHNGARVPEGVGRRRGGARPASKAPGTANQMPGSSAATRAVIGLGGPSD
ncbi:MAG: hypothetical protein AVDCRST_MAG61-2887 [uncultured Friedmanniella sp.]|uniref:Uncharacterized protein n=1 Tax=uncultured Friedmanniella sp. TaxID=335381 RepID=A0A6J4LG41_9ACTN|nr:MAG: hypothetical protein AVDCRST_MAG61-2887 [uncultured Friedmanniella sp.]